jgi:GxxExxY protein
MYAPIPFEANATSRAIIGAAIEVHRVLGPGLLESTYEHALCVELDQQRIRYVRQPVFLVEYKGTSVGQYRPDLIVNNVVLLEIKSVERMNPLSEAQLLAYLRVSKLRVGLLINFNSALLKDGVKRLVL